MSQHDYNIENQDGASFRADINGALAAAVTLNSGPTAPSPTFAGMLWQDDTAGVLKQRNAANTGWVTLLDAIGALAAVRVPSRVILNTANGYGSTNTAIRRFTNTEVNTGGDITYADSATLGASFTINATGLYSISYSDSFTAATAYHGVTADSTQLTTSILSVTPSTVLTITGDANGNFGTCAAVVTYLTAGTVLRPHCAPGVATGGFPAKFNITRMG